MDAAGLHKKTQEDLYEGLKGSGVVPHSVRVCDCYYDPEILEHVLTEHTYLFNRNYAEWIVQGTNLAATKVRKGLLPMEIATMSQFHYSDIKYNFYAMEHSPLELLKISIFFTGDKDFDLISRSAATSLLQMMMQVRVPQADHNAIANFLFAPEDDLWEIKLLL